MYDILVNYQMKIFNNSAVVAKGWYIACPSRDVPKGKAQSTAPQLKLDFKDN